MSINWSYDVMYKWYAKQEAITGSTNEIVTFVYEWKRPSKKDEKKLEPFVTPNMVCLGKSPLQDETLFHNGMYTVVERNTQKTKNKWLFFVYPEEKDCFDKTYMIADHITFCVDKADKKKPVHFHSTTYLCNKFQDMTITSSIRSIDYLPEQLDLPKEGTVDNIIRETIHSKMKPIILDLMRYPWTSSSGGGMRRSKKTNIEHSAREIISHTFSELWNRCEFKMMFAFGTPVRDGITWSVRFVRKGRELRGHLYRAYVFTTETADEKVFQDTLADLANLHERDT